MLKTRKGTLLWRVFETDSSFWTEMEEEVVYVCMLMDEIENGAISALRYIYRKQKKEEEVDLHRISCYFNGIKRTASTALTKYKESLEAVLKKEEERLRGTYQCIGCSKRFEYPEFDEDEDHEPMCEECTREYWRICEEEE